MVDLGGGQRRLSGGTLEQALEDRARLAALRATELLDSAEEPEFDRLTRLGARVLGVPTAVTSLVDDERQFFTACVRAAGRRGRGPGHAADALVLHRRGNGRHLPKPLRQEAVDAVLARWIPA